MLQFSSPCLLTGLSKMLYTVLHDDAVTVWLSHKGGCSCIVSSVALMTSWVVGLVWDNFLNYITISNHVRKKPGVLKNLFIASAYLSLREAAQSRSELWVREHLFLIINSTNHYPATPWLLWSLWKTLSNSDLLKIFDQKKTGESSPTLFFVDYECKGIICNLFLGFLSLLQEE